MASGAYYNEHDPVAAEWLRRLIGAKLIPEGEVDERDIRDVAPDELRGFVQCHFFAGIGIWAHALRRAGWPDDRPIWSGSCPCQPFSDAGRGEGVADERHLWPHWQWLIAHRNPPIVVGEQVASKDGLGWLDLVSADLEGAGYAFGAADLCAAGFGLDWRSTAWREWLQRAVRDCPDPMVAGWLRHFAEWADQSLVVGGQHIRQRLYFVALRLADIARGGRGIGWDEAFARRGRHADRSGDPSGRLANRSGDGREVALLDPRGSDAPAGVGQADGSGGGGPSGVVADAQSDQIGTGFRDQGSARAGGIQPPDGGGAGGLGDSECARPQGHAGHDSPAQGRGESGRPAAAPSLSVGLGDTDSEGTWRDAGTVQGAQAKGSRKRSADRGRRAAAGPAGGADRLDQPSGPRQQGRAEQGPEGDPRDQARVRGPAGGRISDGLDNGLGDGRGAGRDDHGQHVGVEPDPDGDAGRASEADQLRAPFDWVFCRDGFWRPVESGASPLAHAVAGRVGKLRSYGNGLDAETATGFSEIVTDIWEALHG